MGYRNNKLDSCLGGGRAKGCLGGRAGLAWVVAFGVVLIASAGPALGQFNVQPMKVDLQPRPGKQIITMIDIQSLDPAEEHTIDLSLVDLTQNEETGEWEIIEPNSGFDTSTLSSCKVGLSLDPTTIVVGPHQRVPIEVTLRVPSGSRGFSCAGIIASVRPRANATDVSFVLRFLVPVLVEIQGRMTPNKVRVNDVAMEFRPASGSGPGTTILTMNVENTGGTFPRCRPVARIWSWAKGHWRVITTTAFQDKSVDVGIIPGAKIDIRTNLRKTLPPGKYKVAGVLYVDGRRTRRVEKIIDFAGDPSVTSVAADTALDLYPKSEIMVESVAGSTRTTMLKVINGSDETVNIQAVALIPRYLGGRGMGTVKGADMDCSSWIKVVPERFTLSGEQDVQNVRIITKMPRTATTLPYYYANVDFWAFYPDGQNAGKTTATVCVKNIKTKAKASVNALKLGLTPVAGSKYQIVASFENNGIIHFDARNCKAAVTTLASTIPRASTKLICTAKDITSDIMLPFEERSFFGIIDFATLDAGIYRLSAALEHTPGEWEVKQISIEVTIEGGLRVVNVVGMQEELPEILDVTW
jgi:hypothetical protein